MSMDDNQSGIDVKPIAGDLRDNLNEMPVRVGSGAMVQTFAQQIDYAKYMSRAAIAVPEHLRGNIGACLAVVDIATRFDFSPYMVGNKTYVQAGRLCFESQLVHAMIEQSGVLQKRLRATYSGEGDTRNVKIIGWLKGEAEPFEYKSLTLKELHPGHKEKDGKRYVLGSQLWDDKPDVQLFYNATYDWARIHCPDVLMAMGIPPPDARVEDEHRYMGPDNAKDITSTIERLGSSPMGDREGSHPSTIVSELDQLAPDMPLAGASGGQPAGGGADAGGDETPADDAASPPGASKSSTKPGKGGAGAAKGGQTRAAPQGGSKGGGKATPTSDPAKPATGAKSVDLPPTPKRAEDWDAYARATIDAAIDSKALRAWWKADAALRNNLGITKEMRMPAEAEYIDKAGKLEGEGN